MKKIYALILGTLIICSNITNQNIIYAQTESNAYKEYFNVLDPLINGSSEYENGIDTSLFEDDYRYSILSNKKYLLYLTLIDFDNDSDEELFFVYTTGDGSYVYEVYGYENNKLQKLLSKKNKLQSDWRENNFFGLSNIGDKYYITDFKSYNRGGISFTYDLDLYSFENSKSNEINYKYDLQPTPEQEMKIVDGAEVEDFAILSKTVNGDHKSITLNEFEEKVNLYYSNLLNILTYDDNHETSESNEIYYTRDEEVSNYSSESINVFMNKLLYESNKDSNNSKNEEIQEDNQKNVEKSDENIKNEVSKPIALFVAFLSTIISLCIILISLKHFDKDINLKSIIGIIIISIIIGGSIYFVINPKVNNKNTTNELEGTKSEEAIANTNDLNKNPLQVDSINKELDIDDAKKLIQEKVNEYEKSYVDAVNNGDFSILEPNLLIDGSMYNQFKDIVQDYYSRNLKLVLYNHEVKDVVHLGDDEYKINIYEEYGVIKDGQEKIKKFDSIYTIKFEDGKFYMKDILL